MHLIACQVYQYTQNVPLKRISKSEKSPCKILQLVSSLYCMHPNCTEIVTRMSVTVRLITQHGSTKQYYTGWAKKVIPFVHILHCTRGITFLPTRYTRIRQSKYNRKTHNRRDWEISTKKQQFNRQVIVLSKSRCSVEK